MALKTSSWNVNSIRARLNHVIGWLKDREPDVLLLQELKGAEFPDMSRLPIETINKVLAGDEADSHARFLETTIGDIRIVSIYLPNGNPPGSINFAYKLAWMDRLINEMASWRNKNVPVTIGGDFNVIRGHRLPQAFVMDS
jgi:exodeoxyribonuclease III